MGGAFRPTSGKVIAALFNILSSASLTGGDFLDLFAGSGAAAVEALRRGAGKVVCVESDRARAKAISERFGASGFPAERAACICSDVRRAIPRLGREETGRKFVVIFADPPYCMGWGKILPPLMAEHWRLVAPGGVFVFERSSREIPADIFAARDDRIYGETVLSFYWRKEDGT
ncbi:MAG: RsmD family RNA methyltransferase [Synergistaceae bacterium]|jgi:16S rRNA (guanine(966)-N(2))-methyltransferase RsmD|nr:RsmD family RNA methyltransferase [Synergistaceae bacterium]